MITMAVFHGEQLNKLVEGSYNPDYSSVIFKASCDVYEPDVDSFLENFGADCVGKLLPKIGASSSTSTLLLTDLDGSQYPLSDVLSSYSFVLNKNRAIDRASRKEGSALCVYNADHAVEVYCDISYLSYKKLSSVIVEYFEEDNEKYLLKVFFDLPLIMAFLVFDSFSPLVKEEYHRELFVEIFENICTYMFTMYTILVKSRTASMLNDSFKSLTLQGTVKERVDELKSIFDEDHLSDIVSPYLNLASLDILLCTRFSSYCFCLYSLSSNLIPIYFNGHRDLEILKQCLFSKKNNIKPSSNSLFKELENTDTCKTCGVVTEKGVSCVCQT